MHTATKVKVLLVCLAFAGLIHISFLLGQFDVQYIDQQILNNLYQENRYSVFYALVSLLVLSVLAIWQLKSIPARRIHRRFKRIDSEILDNQPELARKFYQAALTYRLKHGHKAYQRDIIKRFDFFYDYHNYALSWIDNILSQTNTNKIPEHFILAVISSGHIGRIYTNADYASGLPASNLKANAPLLFHDCADTIEIWSFTAGHALVKLKKDTIKLHTAHRHPNYISAILTGIDTTQQEKSQVFLRFPTRSRYSGKQTRSEAFAKHNLKEFHSWLKQTSKTRSRFNGDTGIDVSEIDVTGIVNHSSIFTSPLIRRLEQLVYRKIDAFYPRSRLPVADAAIALDAVVLCKGIGIITLSEKLEQGDITYSGDPTWYQFRGDQAFELPNPCAQAKIAKSSLSHLLSEHNLTHWPIVSLVVYSKENVSLNMAIGSKRIQCHVLKLKHLEKWINRHQTHDDINFTQNDISHFNNLFSQRQAMTGTV